MKDNTTYSSPYEFKGRIPLKHAIPLGIQHVLAMFVGNLTPLIIVCGACGITSDEPALYVALLQNAMLVAGLVTLVQLFSIGPIGGQVPIIMGTSSGFLGVMRSIAATMGGGVIAYSAILGASIIGGLFETVLGFFIKPLRKLFPPVVTGTVVLAIGLSLISVGVNSFAGGSGANDFGSAENLLIGFCVLAVIVILKHFTKGITSTSAILFGIIFGYILCAVLGLILPHTGINADGVEYTKAWVINWSKIGQSAWISIPKILPVMPTFRLDAILPMCIMFIVTTVETVGDTAGCIEGGMGREATDKELAGAVTCDGVGSTFAALFGVLPNTSFSQNDQGRQQVCTDDRRDLSCSVRTQPQACGGRFHYAAERAWRCGCHDVLIDRYFRNSAAHKARHHEPNHHDRVRRTGHGLWTRRYRRGCRWARQCGQSRVRRFRHRSGCAACHRAQSSYTEGG